MKDPRRFAAFVLAAQRALGLRHTVRSEAHMAAERKLREEVFVDWWNLPRV